MTILDVTGAVDYIKAYGSKNIEVIYIKASENLRVQRAAKRDPNGFNRAEWDRRAADDAEKFKNCVSVINYLHFLINRFTYFLITIHYLALKTDGIN